MIKVVELYPEMLTQEALDILDASIETLAAEDYPAEQGLRFVWQWHWRGESVHGDLRFEWNDHLRGFTVFADKEDVKGDSAVTNEPGMGGRKLRATRKARQPKQWLEVKGEVPPGEVGATKNLPGIFEVYDKGTYEYGAQKPYLYEFFLHGKKLTGRWLIRAFRFPRLGPKKQPQKGKYDLVLLLWKPEDQTPYAVSKRARELRWFPPKGVIPLPKEWIDEHPEEYQEWLEQAKEAWKRGVEKELPAWERRTAKESEDKPEICDIEWVVHEATWKGQEVIRRMPNVKWFLRLKIEGKVRSFELDGHPLWSGSLTTFDEGIIDDKWFDFEGEIPPRGKYNPTKTLPVTMSILFRGRGTLTDTGEPKQRWLLKLKDKELAGTWILEQEEEGSEVWTLSRGGLASLAEVDFVCQHHWWGDEHHWDIRLKFPERPYHDKWALEANPIEARLEQETPTMRSRGFGNSWMEFEGKIPPGKEGNPTKDKIAYVEVLDKGKAIIHNDSPRFLRLTFKGEKLKGYCIFVRRNTVWHFIKSRLPQALKAGDPRKGEPYDPPKVEETEGSIEFTFYDIKAFTVAVPQSKLRRYIEDIPEGVHYNLAQYPVEGELPEVRIQSITFDKPKWTKEKAEQFIKETKPWEFLAKQVKGEQLTCPNCGEVLDPKAVRLAKLSDEFNDVFRCSSCRHIFSPLSQSKSI